MTNRKWPHWTLLALLIYAGGGMISDAHGTSSSGVTTSAAALSAGQVRVATRIATPFATLAGSQDNAVALATALRTGTTAELVYTSTSSTGDAVQTTAEITVPTRPMGWGNVSHALALAAFALQQAGVTDPTAADLQAALDGGTVTASDGTTVTLAGVLQQRADGMGWGQIAQSYGTTMGAINRGLHTAATGTVTTPSTTSTTSAAATRPAGAGAGSHAAGGLTTAGGALAVNGSHGHAAMGITTATGASGGASSGVVTATGDGAGQGHAYGRGVVTAAGGGAPVSGVSAGGHGGISGVVTASGGAASPIANAGSGNGASDVHGKGAAKGKGGG